VEARDQPWQLSKIHGTLFRAVSFLLLESNMQAKGSHLDPRLRRPANRLVMLLEAAVNYLLPEEQEASRFFVGV
jgi:hypothetical protein